MYYVLCIIISHYTCALDVTHCETELIFVFSLPIFESWLSTLPSQSHFKSQMKKGYLKTQIIRDLLKEDTKLQSNSPRCFCFAYKSLNKGGLIP